MLLLCVSVLSRSSRESRFCKTIVMQFYFNSNTKQEFQNWSGDFFLESPLKCVADFLHLINHSNCRTNGVEIMKRYVLKVFIFISVFTTRIFSPLFFWSFTKWRYSIFFIIVVYNTNEQSIPFINITASSRYRIISIIEAMCCKTFYRFRSLYSFTIFRHLSSKKVKKRERNSKLKGFLGNYKSSTLILSL